MMCKDLLFPKPPLPTVWKKRPGKNVYVIIIQIPETLPRLSIGLFIVNKFVQRLKIKLPKIAYQHVGSAFTL